MTSASELFYNRRLRFSRNSNSNAIGVGVDLDSPPSADRTSRRHRHYHNSGPNQTRRDRGCDPLRRAPSHHAPSASRRNSHSSQEREPNRPEGGSHLFSSGSGDGHSESHNNAQDNLRNNANDRLPGAVLLARERLLQRLRGVSLSGSSRQRNGQSSSHHHNDVSNDDAIGLVDIGEWETEISREWLTTITSPTNSSISQQLLAKRPPGLTQREVESLQVEVFGIQEESNGLSSSEKAFSECSICLESFSEGDELIRLPCGHRYHFCCLDPWVRTCGDCPYCRRGIDAKYRTNSEDLES